MDGVIQMNKAYKNCENAMQNLLEESQALQRKAQGRLELVQATELDVIDQMRIKFFALPLKDQVNARKLTERYSNENKNKNSSCL